MESGGFEFGAGGLELEGWSWGGLASGELELGGGVRGNWG